MHQQHPNYWQSQAHPNARYPSDHYPNQYPAQNVPKPSPVFRSQAELGFELPPVRPAQGQPQQRPMPRGAPPPPSQLQGRPRPQSMGYPQASANYAHVPSMHTNRVGGIPPQHARSSSASPTRKPLPSPSPVESTRPLTITQSSGFTPLAPNHPHSRDLSAFSRFNQERMASGAISPGTVRNVGPVKAFPNSYAPQQSQYQYKDPVANMSSVSSFSAPPSQQTPSLQASNPVTINTPTRRRVSPPRFFGNSSPSSRNHSPEKAKINTSATMTNSLSHNSPHPSHVHAPQTSTSQSRVATSSLQTAPQSNSTFSSIPSAAVRQQNPIFETKFSSTRSGFNATPGTETKFVPLWKRDKPINNIGGSSRETERGRSTTVPPTSPGRPLPQPTPNRFPASYTVEEPDDDAANTSLESETTSSEVSGVSAASGISGNSQRSGASSGPGILDLRGSIPQPPSMDRAVVTTGAIPAHSMGFRSGARNIPQPPGMDRAGATTGAIHEGSTGSMTLRFAKMELDLMGSGSPWPQDLPPLPRGPGSGFSNSQSFSRPTSAHPPSSSPRHSHTQSQPQTHSSFANVKISNHSGPRGKAERTIPDYDLDEPPPRPASVSFSARSVSPAGSTASSTSGALERFKRNTQQPAQPQPQHASYPRLNDRPESIGHSIAYAGVKIESPSPLGGKEKMADVRKMENDSKSTSHSQPIPAIRFENNDRRSQPNQSEVPRITFGDDENESSGIQITGQDTSTPRNIIGNDSDDSDDDNSNASPFGPLIRVSAENEGQQSTPNPPQIMFEVPGMGVDSQFGGPVIHVSDESDQDTPRRRGKDVTTAPHQGGPRALPAVRSGASQSGRGGLTCPACVRPIIGRVVGAMGMKWHPDCFRCTICNELLEFQSSYEGIGEDGIKRPYCHLDYHETFAPRCYHCKTAIVEERFISLNDTALGRRTYHEQHFFCAECGDPFLSPSSAAKHNHERDFGKSAGGELTFSGDGTFSYDDDEEDNVGFTVFKGHPYCEACHVRLRLPKCKRCKRPIRDHMEAVEALGGKWCWECFRCTNCDQPFEDPSYFERDRKPYCENCFSVMIRNEI
ncbi:hypothetical protein F5051DRAFT_404460 [Lentinula edodes]|nr:hypothetical protein F5051DRAFT_404460 [Lentinula edodes]